MRAVRFALIAVIGTAGCGFSISGTAPPASDGSTDVATGDVDATVSDAAMIDGPLPPIDAMAWTPSSCPAGYNVVIASTMTSSRYRFKKTGAQPAVQAADCQNDGSNTHIVSLDTLDEISQLHAAADAQQGWARVTEHPNDDLIYVGGVQRPSQTQLGTGWISYAGGPQVASWADDEPNDWALTDGVEDGEEQLLVIWLQEEHLGDMVATFDLPVICECDSTPPSAAFTTAFAAAVN
jgi:hypothetical protein